MTGIGNNAGTGADNTKNAYKLSVSENGILVTAHSNNIIYNNAIYGPSGSTLSFPDVSSTGNWYAGTKKLDIASGTYSYTTTTAENLTPEEYPSIAGLTYNRTGDYFEITSAADLVILANHVKNGYDCAGINFKQTQNITFGDEENASFTAIGNATTKFLGCYDGDGYTIDNLKIDSTEDNQGLFGVVGAGSSLTNINLTDAEVKGSLNVGGRRVGTAAAR